MQYFQYHANRLHLLLLWTLTRFILIILTLILMIHCFWYQFVLLFGYSYSEEVLLTSTI